MALLGAGFLLLPLVLILGLALGERLTEARWAEAMAELDAVTGVALPVVAPFEEPPEGPEGFWCGTREAVAGLYAAAGVLRQDAQALFMALLTISGIFLLRMVVLPAALLWAVPVIFRRMLAEPPAVRAVGPP